MPQPEDAAPSVTCRLALGAQAGEAGVFEALHARLSPSILAWARMPMHRHLHALMEPDDFAQEVWIRATRRLDHFDPRRGTFRQWVFKIAKNMSIDLLRQYARARHKGAPQPRGGSSMHELGAEAAADPSTWRQVAHSEALDGFMLRVQDLPREDQLLLVHCGMEEQPVSAVAARLEISEAATHKRWQRLRARLVRQGLPEGVIE